MEVHKINFRRLKYLLLFLLVVIFVNCNNKPFLLTDKTSTYEDGYCNLLPSDIDIYIYRYQETAEKKHIKEAMMLLDSALIYCENKMQLIDKKFNLYVLSSNYQSGINFIESLDPNIFSLSPFYIKDFYIKTLSSLILNENQDTVSRNKLNKEICEDIESYFIFRYPDYFKKEVKSGNNIKLNISELFKSDLKTVFLYYIVRGRYENINNLIEELQTFEIDNDFEKKMRDEIIFTLENMNKKDKYHIEYNI